MFNVEFPVTGKKFRVEFSHGTKTVDAFVKGQKTTLSLPTTTAYIIDTTELDTWTKADAMITASVTCDSRDEFSRNEGRKKALAQALIEMTNDRNVRREFWGEYVRAVSWKYMWMIDFSEDLS